MSPTSAGSLSLGRRVVRVLSGAKALEEAVEGTLRELVDGTPWTTGAVWRLDERSGLLTCAGAWSADSAAAELCLIMRRLTFAPGIGLPGAVFESLSPQWIEDLRAAAAEVLDGFPRADAVLDAGLGAVLDVPISSADGPLGVLEVLGPPPRRPEPWEVEAVAMVAQQLGAYLGRARVERRLRASEETGASIVRAALDCIVTMDHRGRVLDFNPAAEAVFGYERDAVIGERLGDLIIPPELRDAHHRALGTYVREGRPTILNQRLELTGMRADGTQFPVELTVTRLGTHDPPTFAGFMRDITERRDAERAAREAADALQRSLLPPHLPAIDGVEVGAAYRGGTEGWEVGGDFYDVFEVGRGSWALVLGDVCGKGVEAAATTAMVRYAVRAAAVKDSGPTEVLAALNEAMLSQTPRDSFCTALYACLDVSGPRPTVKLAVGGHPLPLLLRADGTVVQAGLPGTLLGAFTSAASRLSEYELAAGEVLLLYTDGATEARGADGRLLGIGWLSDRLAECRGLPAEDVAARLEAAVLEATGGRVPDDLALVAVRAP